jgi:hypothetical protein
MCLHALLCQLLLLLLLLLLPQPLLCLPLRLSAAVCPMHNSCSCTSASFLCCVVSFCSSGGTGNSIACKHTDGVTSVINMIQHITCQCQCLRMTYSHAAY